MPITLSRRDRSRDNWWEPYIWESTGMGMSYVLERDFSQQMKIKGRKIKSARVYGLQGKQFLPMRTVLEFGRCYLVFDRGVHNPGNMRVYNVKTGEYGETITEILYISINQEDKSFNPNPMQGHFPVGGVQNLEKAIEHLEGNTVSKLTLRGNNTLAVGFLVNEVLLTTRENYFVRINRVKLDADSIEKNFGDAKDVAKLYALVVHGGKVKP